MNFPDFTALKESVGMQLPPSEWITVTQDMINAFAEGTDDHQWIHVDEEKAKVHSPFKTTVAHGFLSISLLASLLRSMIKVETGKLAINYGLNKVRFPAPVPVNSRLRLHCKISDIRDYAKNGLKVTWRFSIEIEDNKKPACIGEWITLMFD